MPRCFGQLSGFGEARRFEQFGRKGEVHGHGLSVWDPDRHPSSEPDRLPSALDQCGYHARSGVAEARCVAASVYSVGERRFDLGACLQDAQHRD
jgi:hypothetical protein